MSDKDNEFWEREREKNLRILREEKAAYGPRLAAKIKELFGIWCQPNYPRIFLEFKGRKFWIQLPPSGNGSKKLWVMRACTSSSSYSSDKPCTWSASDRECGNREELDQFVEDALKGDHLCGDHKADHRGGGQTPIAYYVGPTIWGNPELTWEYRGER